MPRDPRRPGDRVPARGDDHGVSGEQEKRRALDAGADDFIAKPFDHAELLARVRSLLRIKRYHDELERYTAGLRRFLPPEVADLVKADPSVLETHRREVAVLVCGLHGFAAFAETAAPEDVMAVLAEYHGAVGALDRRRRRDALAPGRGRRHRGPQRPAAGRRPGAAWRSRSPSRCATACGSSASAGRGSASPSRRRSAWPSATPPSAGSAPTGAGSTRPVGPAPLLAERLAEAATAGQILVSQRVEAAVEAITIETTLPLRGFTTPVRAFDLVGT